MASASRQRGLWTVETVSGTKVSGSTLAVTPRGFLISRENALFNYVAGAGLKSRALPEGYMFAAHQNGSISATGWLLLQKRAETKQAEGNVIVRAAAGTAFGELFSTAKQLGATLGVTQADADFALYNAQAKKLLPIRIALGDQQANFLSQCRARNAWVAQCDRLDTIESLYGQDGAPNRQHYFWRTGTGSRRRRVRSR
ncbi:MAG: hypothetical protein MZW92_57305 [Comamonadaceae bacterium]|nr:hypothetical protein [Comamonadaceae bacterium]